ncbi:MAG: WYL domain-containing protein [Alcanivoracaceae bacterium]|nr:WYL domain-containing protein [Alcanivoracaceae bacterium]
MPRDANISNKAFRLISLLRAIPREPQQVTSRDLLGRLASEGHDIDKRTVERYLSELAASEEFGGLLKCNERSKPYGWSFRRDAELSLPGMDAAMAVTWDLVDRYLSTLLPDAARARLEPTFSAAQRWLKKHQPGGQPAWSRKVAFAPRGLQLLPAEVQPAVLEIVYTALYQGDQLDVWYKDKASPYRVHPQALVDRGPVRYLVAPVGDHENPVLFALHRIKKAHPVDSRARVLPDFDLAEYIQGKHLEFPVGPEITLKVRFFNGAGHHLMETPLTVDQKLVEEADGQVLLTTRVQETQELYWWIQGFGANVEVLAPKAVRRQLAADLREAVARYADC